MITEFETCVDIGWSNMHSEGPTKVNGYINSMENAISKSKSTLTK